MNPVKRLKVNTPIAPVSAKMRKNLSQYDKLATGFKAMHPHCQAKLPGCTSNTTDVHHKAGRGVNLCNVNTFLAVCRNCHQIIELNPQLVREYGFTESRLETKTNET